MNLIDYVRRTPYEVRLAHLRYEVSLLSLPRPRRNLTPTMEQIALMAYLGNRK